MNPKQDHISQARAYITGGPTVPTPEGEVGNLVRQLTGTIDSLEDRMQHLLSRLETVLCPEIAKTPVDELAPRGPSHCSLGHGLQGVLARLEVVRDALSDINDRIQL